jgi:hypothetical protein
MNNDNKFPEQEAPEKNTDKAFVQVGKDGAPHMPDTDDKKGDSKQEEDTTTLGKR